MTHVLVKPRAALMVLRYAPPVFFVEKYGTCELIMNFSPPHWFFWEFQLKELQTKVAKFTISLWQKCYLILRAFQTSAPFAQALPCWWRQYWPCQPHQMIVVNDTNFLHSIYLQSPLSVKDPPKKNWLKFSHSWSLGKLEGNIKVNLKYCIYNENVGPIWTIILA